MVSLGTCEVEVQSDNGALAFVDLTLVGAVMMQTGFGDGVKSVHPDRHLCKLIHLLAIHLPGKQAWLLK